MTLRAENPRVELKGGSFRQKSLAWALCLPFAVVIVSGLLIYSKNNILPVQDVLILVLLLLMLCGRWTRSPGRVGAAVVLLIYGTIHVLLGLADQNPLADVAQAHKWIFFLAVLFLVQGTPGLDGAVSLLTKVLLAAALVKTLALALIDPGSRLGLLAESNFEITMYCMLVALSWRNFGRRRVIWVAVLAICAGLSLSRSGAIAFFVLVLFIIVSTPTRNKWLVLVRPFVIAASVVVPVVVFAGRGSSIEDSDRAHFLNLFLEVSRDRNVMEWIFGAPSITALPDNICSNLSYYATLFASNGSGACYSVVLHVFVLRVLLDFGIVGLALSMALPFVAMKTGGVRIALASTLSIIAFVNGLSVSGVNSEFVILPILLAIMTRQDDGERALRLEIET